MDRRHLALPLLAALTLAASGCGGSDLKDSGIPDGSQTGTAAAAPTPTTGTTDAAPAQDAAKAFPGTAVEPVKNATDLKKKPGIPKPKGKPGTKLVVKDLVVGKGAAAKSGDALTVRYTGVSYSTGKEFDASWKTPENMFPFTLGQGAVIMGWDQGIVGMKPGGRRELVIPAALGYGDAGSPPNIKGGETLVFVVDLLKIG